MAGRRCGARGAFTPGAFTLLELLVVIAIIALLSSISFVVIRGAILRARIAQTKVEVMNLVGAIVAYRYELGAYPPDTDNWNETVTDPRSIHRYLGRKLTDPFSKKVIGPFFSIQSLGAERLGSLDADGIGILMDPWGKPYHLDAMHMQMVSGAPKPTGEPYLPTRPKTEMLKDFKVVSFGPDGVSAPYPFDQNPPDPKTKGNIKSW